MQAGGGAALRTGVTPVAIAVMLLVVSPLAGADAAGFSTRGALSLPAEATLRVAPAAVFVAESLDLERLVLVADKVRVSVVHDEFPEIAAGEVRVGTPPRGWRATYALTDVRVELSSGGVSGILGIYPRDGASATLTTSTSLALTPESALRIGNGRVAHGPEGAPADPTYARVLPGPVLDARGGGAFSYEGPGGLKLNGPTLTIEARENTTRLETGRRVASDGGPVAQVRETILLLDFENARLEFDHSGVQVAAAEVALEWDGVAVVRDMHGEVRTDEGAFFARGETVRLDGQLSGDASAIVEADGQAAALVRLQGHLASTSLAPSGRVATPSSPWLPWGLGLVVALSVAVGVSGILYARRRAHGSDLSVEQLRDLADAAMENLRFADALAWLERAQAVAPNSARLWMDRGYCHASLGEVDAALAAYERAATLSTDAEADLLAASLLLRAGTPDVEAAERHVLRALERSPEVALEIQVDSVFDPLRQRPRVTRQLRRALGDRQA